MSVSQLRQQAIAWLELLFWDQDEKEEMNRTTATAATAIALVMGAAANGADLTLSVASGSDCVTSAETVTVTLSMASLAGSGLNNNEASGFQAFLSYPSTQLQFASATYTASPFGLPIITGGSINPSAGLIDLAAGINQFGGQSPTSAGAVLVTLTFTTLVDDDCTNAVTFRAHTPATGITDVNGALASPLNLSGSPNIAIDSTQPSIDTAASNQTVECDGAGNSATLAAWLANNGGAAATDNCSGVTWSHNFTALSNLCGATGSAAVNFTATDGCGNFSVTSATFTIADTTDPTITLAAADQTVECDGAGNVAQLNAWLANNGGATATDTCGGVTWSNNFTVLSDLCGATGLALVTFTATDDCGNDAITTATFTIQDTTDPTITLAAGDQTVECDGLGNVGALSAWLGSNGGATATDACGGVTWSHDFAALSDDCGATGSATVTFTATDDCGNDSMTTATFTIDDTTDPTIILAAADETVECDGAGNTAELNAWLASNGGATASDACSGVTWSHDFTALSEGCGATGLALVTFTATDDCDNDSITTATFTIEDTTPPVVSGCPVTVSQNADAGGCTALIAWTAPTADDDCDPNPAITYDIDLNDNAVVDTTIAVATYLFPTGTHRVTVKATDACTNTDDTCDFTVTIAPFNTLVATVQLAGGFASPLTRCVTFGFCSGGSPIERTANVVITGGSGTATVTDLPCGSYTCVSARDELHTLRRTDTDGFAISGTNFVANFTTAGPTNDSLIAGNLNDDEFIDIIDFGIFTGQYGNTPSGSTPCLTSGPHADISGNGAVDTGDFTFIGINFLNFSEPACACPLSGGHGFQIAPVVAVSVDDLVAMGLPQAVRGDLNGDGWVDPADMAAFMMGARPQGLVAIDAGPGDWSDQSTWVGRSIPDAQTNVILSSAITIEGMSAFARDVTIGQGASLTFKNGSLTAHSMVVRTGAMLRISGTATVLSLGSLILEFSATLSWDGGVIEIDGGVYSQADLDLVIGSSTLSTLRLVEGASASIIRDTYLGWEAGEAGALEIDGATFATGGSLLVGGNGAGWLDLRNGGIASAGQPIAIGHGGTVSGRGTLQGAVHNNGVISPDGAIDIQGSFTQAPGGELVLALHGDGHDALRIDGHAVLGGRLRIALGAGFVPVAGASYSLVTAGSMSGAFDSVSLAAPGAGWSFDVVRGSAGLRLVVRQVVVKETMSGQ